MNKGELVAAVMRSLSSPEERARDLDREMAAQKMVDYLRDNPLPLKGVVTQPDPHWYKQHLKQSRRHYFRSPL